MSDEKSEEKPLDKACQFIPQQVASFRGRVNGFIAVEALVGTEGKPALHAFEGIFAIEEIKLVPC